MEKELTLAQGKRLNEILEEYCLEQMSIKSVTIWFSSGVNKIYRDINHLSKQEIFDLFSKLREDILFIDRAKSILDVELIVDTSLKKFAISIGLFTDKELGF